MLALSILVAIVCLVTALLGIYYTARDLSADLVLLGACALAALTWVVLGVALGLRDLGGGHPPDPITLYGYLLTGVLMTVGGGWVGVWERSRFGSLVIAVVALVSMVLLLRLTQIWPGGFA
ncbi:hypothetical protein BH708_03645 [Brachybacterium sp. P6-10-X1]|uniref:hypothetical protein n=1 Tax=Brachybacterium sp. P6-10-X1 TaxID=1903186 RepID=UPI000971A9FA|nr:hypothetical protein [Brachybacterium sp. P6-10-X1]APX31970.1 hypothetical protein BH708_03645 [Brachybacterium sp. P6-10-X1]